MFMRKHQIWICLILAIWAALPAVQHWVNDRNAEQSVIIDMTEDREAPQTAPDTAGMTQTITPRIVADIGGAVLVLLGVSILIAAVVGFRSGR